MPCWARSAGGGEGHGQGGRGGQTCGKDYLADILTILISHGRRDATMIVKCFKGLVVALNHTSLRVGVGGGPYLLLYGSVVLLRCQSGWV